MGGKQTKSNCFSINANECSPSQIHHHKKSKLDFNKENENINQKCSNNLGYSFFHFPCMNLDNQKGYIDGKNEDWKHLFRNRCSELENQTFWAGKFTLFLKKFKQNVPDEYFLDQFKEIQPPTRILSEKKQLEFLEDSLNLSSINNNDKTYLLQSNKTKENFNKNSQNNNTKNKNSINNEDYKKQIKKILSKTEIFDENFTENLLNSTSEIIMKPNSPLMIEPRKSNRSIEDYQIRKFSLEENDFKSKNSFRWGRNSLDNNKENFHFKNNTFVIDYQTFLSNLNSADDKKNLKNEEKYLFIKHYKEVTEKIEEHFKRSEHPLGFFFQRFLDLFEKEYENKMILYHNEIGNIDKYKEIYDEAIENIKDMIRLMQEAIFLYYNLKKYKDPTHSIFLFTKDNIVNFLTSLTFENEYIYEYLLTLQKNIDVFKEITISKSIEKTRNLKPCDFGISEKISLNEETIAYFRKTDENFDVKNKKQTIFFQPYKKAIKNLKQIEIVKSPLHKLKVVLKCAECIMKCIRRFYEENDRVFSDNISGDEVLMVFIYIINKSNVSFLVSHCNFIEKFITNQLACSISGYYFSTIMAALNYIENIK